MMYKFQTHIARMNNNSDRTKTDVKKKKSMMVSYKPTMRQVLHTRGLYQDYSHTISFDQARNLRS